MPTGGLVFQNLMNFSLEKKGSNQYIIMVLRPKATLCPQEAYFF